MRTLKLLLTNKIYRQATLERLKLKFLLLPGIKNIVAWIYSYKVHKKMKNMDNWDKHVAMRNMENDSKTFCFVSALICLQACIMAEGEEEELFQQARSNVLSNNIINQPHLKEFKEWLEKIDSSEKDFSRVQDLINSFTKTQ